MHRKMLFSFGLAALLGTSTIAVAKPSFVFSQGKAKVIVAPQGTFTPPLAHRPGAPAIFSNIGTKYPKGEYFPSEGYSIAGPDSAIGSQAWLAAAFTPAVNATVTELDVGVGWLDGTNGVVIGLYSDNHGLPGKLLKSFTVANLPQAGQCCALVVAKDTVGLPLTAGTQYWLGLTTNAQNEDALIYWTENTTNEVDKALVAANTGAGWSATSYTPAPAFGVYGK